MMQIREQILWICRLDFFPCFAAGLAYYISLKRAPERTAQLKALYEEEFRRAADQDEDRASFNIRPSIRMM